MVNSSEPAIPSSALTSTSPVEELMLIFEIRLKAGLREYVTSCEASAAGTGAASTSTYSTPSKSCTRSKSPLVVKEGGVLLELLRLPAGRTSMAHIWASPKDAAKSMFRIPSCTCTPKNSLSTATPKLLVAKMSKSLIRRFPSMLTSNLLLPLSSHVSSANLSLMSYSPFSIGMLYPNSLPLRSV